MRNIHGSVLLLSLALSFHARAGLEPAAQVDDHAGGVVMADVGMLVIVVLGAQVARLALGHIKPIQMQFLCVDPRQG